MFSSKTERTNKMSESAQNKGFIKFSNSLCEALYKTDLNGSELRVALFIIRKTYGFNKPQERLSVSFISDNTNMPFSTVRRSLTRLIRMNIVFSHADGTNSVRMLGINPDCESWGINNISDSEIYTADEAAKSKDNTENITQEIIDETKNDIPEMDDEPKNDVSEMTHDISEMNTCCIIFDTSELVHNKRQYIKDNNIKTDMAGLPERNEIEFYVRSHGYTFDPERFMHYYDSKGWTSGGKPVRNWKALADMWQRYERPRIRQPSYVRSFGGAYDISEYESHSIADED